MNEPNTFLEIIETATGKVVQTIGLQRTDHRYVKKVMQGILINMDTDKYYIDDSKAYGTHRKEFGD